MEDLMILKTEFMRGLISKLIMKALKKKGYDVLVSIKDFEMSSEDKTGKVTATASVKLVTNRENIEKWMKG